MGQRLNIEIVKGEQVLANAYYHWSGYTSSAICLTMQIIKEFNNVDHDNDIVRAIRLLELTGAGLTNEERNYFLETFPELATYNLQNCYGRNDGLISVSEKGMKETRYWEEARVTVDILSKNINFGAIYKTTLEQYLNDYATDECDYKEVEVFDIENVTFEDFEEKGNLIKNLIENKIYGLLLSNKTVISFIE